jgi:uncharacterized protein YoxC
LDDRWRAREPLRAETGAFTAANIVVLAVVLVAASVAAVLLGRTMAAAVSIDEKAETIARTGRGINISTDAIIRLNRTNDLARSIRDSVAPLDGRLSAIIAAGRSVEATAQAIDTTAARINTIAADILSTAGDIDATAGDIHDAAKAINATAGGINREAAEILDVAERIEFDVAQINRNLDDTIALAERVLSDTQDILGQAVAAHQTTACLDQKLVGRNGNDGHCSGLAEEGDGEGDG